MSSTARKMCPYNRGREVQKYRQTNTLDESGEVNGYEYVLQVDLVPLPCAGELCGAWRDGRCCYAAVSLDTD